jgi:hypothetical protein
MRTSESKGTLAMSNSSAVFGFEVPVRASDQLLELQIHRTSR